jgi:hypothetical protein
MKFIIKKLTRQVEARACAQIMATSEPWITLERNYAAALTAFGI